MLKIQEQSIMKVTIDGKGEDEQRQAEEYADRQGYKYKVSEVKGGKFQLVGSKVML